MVTYGLHILGVLTGFQNFATHFLDESLSQEVAHVDDLPLLGDAHVVLGILFLCVARRPFLSHMDNTSFFFFLVFFNKFQQESYVNMWGHYGSKIMGVFFRAF